MQKNQPLLFKGGLEEGFEIDVNTFSPLMFDSVLRTVESSLNKKYLTLMEIYKELKMVEKKW